MNTQIRPIEILKQNLLACLIFAVCFCVFTATLLVTTYEINKNVFNSGHANAQSGDIAWPVFDGGEDDPGSNNSETAINATNVADLHKLWEVATPAAVDSAVVEEPNVTTGSGVMDLVFINTIEGNLIAYNAATGAKIWEDDPSATNFNGQGTKSTPAIDPSGKYIYAYALDGYIHKYNIANGAEVTGNGFPAQVTLLPNNVEKGSASINIANGYLYMTISGNDGDYGHYVGHVIAVNLSSGTETVWNAECANITQLLYTSGSNYCANNQAGIWARPGVKIDPVTGNVFVVTGNGNYNANSGGNNWGDSLIELTPNLSTIIDSYTPTTYNSLDSGDLDLGSSAPVILPTQNSSNTPYMLVQAGKDGIFRLLNRSNLSGQGGPRHTGGEMQTLSISDEVHEQPAVWVDGSGNTWVFLTDESGDLYAYKLVTTSGVSSLTQEYEKTSLGVSSSPFIANGVMYIDGNNILALNPTTGATLFTSSSLGISLNQHWESPVVVNGTLFTADDNGNLMALDVPSTVPTASLSANPTSIVSGGSTTLSWSSTNATSCSASSPSGWTSSTAVSGTQSLSPSSTTTYTIICTGSSGSTQASVTVSVYPSCKVPFYRLRNVQTGDHFYTTNVTEATNAIDSGGYAPEGIVGYVDLTDQTGDIALYRLRNVSNGQHFYTTSSGEESALISNGYVSEGIAGYVASSSGSGISELYRLRNVSNGQHFYTDSISEESSLVASNQFVLEGSAGYVYDVNPGGCREPFYRLRNVNNGDHLYTASFDEYVSAVTAAGYAPEGITGYVDGNSVSGDTALYRLRQKSTNDHFYTTSLSEETSLVNGGSFVSEGTAGYIASSSGSNQTGLIRLLNKQNGQHFYTNSTSEASGLTSSGAYVNEGTIGYVYNGF